jgi:hypothetical protein
VTAQPAEATAPATEAAAPAARVSRYEDTSYPPLPPETFLRETTLEDAIGYRLWRLTQLCPDCGDDPAANRCGDHRGDLDLIVTYYKALQAAERASRAATAARHERESREGPD